MLHLLAQQYYCTTPPVVAIPRVVEIVMAPEAAMCKTKYHGAHADAAVEELKALLPAIAAGGGNCSLPGPHVVIPEPDEAEGQEYRG